MDTSPASNNTDIFLLNEMDNDNNIPVEEKTIEEMNKKLYNLKTKNTAMESFVTKKKLHVTQIHVPVQRNINLKSPELKMKGVKSKKK